MRAWSFRILLVAIGAAGGIALMMVIDHQPWLLRSIQYNLTWDRTREWLEATGGWVAALIAAIPIYFLWKQIDQARKVAEDQRRGIADTILIDVQDTGERLPLIQSLPDLSPTMSALARGMILDATSVAPELAIALQKHCREVAAFESAIRARTGNRGTISGSLLEDVKKLAFRATVLSWCFGVASEQIRRTGRATGPYIARTNLADWENRYDVVPKDRAYLQHLFDGTGIADS